MPQEFILFYLIPLAICVVFSWIEQILEYKEPYVIAGLGIIPIVNIVAAAIATMITVGWIGIAIISLPTTIKRAIKKGNTE